MNKVLKIIFFVAVVMFVTSGFCVSVEAGSDDPYNLKMAAKVTGVLGSEGSKSIPQMLGSMVGTALSLVSVLFFGLVVYGGFTWMVSRGDEADSKQALNIIFGAITGILVVLASYTIVSFVLESAKGGVTPGGSAVDGIEIIQEGDEEGPLDGCDGFDDAVNCELPDGDNGEVCVWEVAEIEVAEEDLKIEGYSCADQSPCQGICNSSDTTCFIGGENTCPNNGKCVLRGECDDFLLLTESDTGICRVEGGDVVLGTYERVSCADFGWGTCKEAACSDGSTCQPISGPTTENFKGCLSEERLDGCEEWLLDCNANAGTGCMSVYISCLKGEL